MSGPLSDETMAEIREWLVNDQPSVQADVYASLLLAEWDRLRAEPRLWHSETEGYVLVDVSEESDGDLSLPDPFVYSDLSAAEEHWPYADRPDLRIYAIVPLSLFEKPS